MLPELKRHSRQCACEWRTCRTGWTQPRTRLAYRQLCKTCTSCSAPWRLPLHQVRQQLLGQRGACVGHDG